MGLMSVSSLIICLGIIRKASAQIFQSVSDASLLWRTEQIHPLNSDLGDVPNTTDETHVYATGQISGYAQEGHQALMLVILVISIIIIAFILRYAAEITRNIRSFLARRAVTKSFESIEIAYDVSENFLKTQPGYVEKDNFSNQQHSILSKTLTRFTRFFRSSQYTGEASPSVVLSYYSIVVCTNGREKIKAPRHLTGTQSDNSYCDRAIVVVGSPPTYNDVH